MQRTPLLALGGVLATAAVAVAVLDFDHSPQALGSPPAEVAATDAVTNIQTTVSDNPERIRTKVESAERNRTEDGGRTRKQEETQRTSLSVATNVRPHDSEIAPGPVPSTNRGAHADTARSSKADSQGKEQTSPTFPKDAEAKIWQVLAANQHLNFTSIDRVECRPTICEIRFTGGPDLSDSGPLSRLWDSLNSVLPMIKSGQASSRVEISPGLYSSTFTIRSTIGSDLLGGFKSGS